MKPNRRWLSPEIPIGAIVVRAEIISADASLQLELKHPHEKRERILRVQPPWTFSSCLFAFSSDQLAEDGSDSLDLIGLEGAALSSASADANRIDLTFGSICVSGSALR